MGQWPLRMTIAGFLLAQPVAVAIGSARSPR